MTFIKKILFLFIAMIFSWQSYSTHLVGGEIYYECLGGNQYKIYLKIYRECGPANTNNTDFDPQAYITIYKTSGGNNTFYATEQMAFPGRTQLPVQLNNPCLSAPPSICTQEAIYTKTITLPPSPGGYNIIHQRCCRNPTILNIVNPQNYGNTYLTHIPGDVTCNNAPYFNNTPPLALCANEPFVFDHSATDPDSDSLVYEFCTPFHGASSTNPMPTTIPPPPFSNVIWNNGFNVNYQITSNPALTINPNTGLIQGTPTQPGLYVVGICVKEYRNGVLINENRRDFQFTVVNCAVAVLSAVQNQQIFCDGLTAAFTNQSQGSSFYHWDFGVAGINSDTSNLTSPTYTFPDTGDYIITLIANPGWPCSDTSTAIFKVQHPINSDFDITSPLIQCEFGNSFNFDAYGDFSFIPSFSWSFGPNANTPNSTSEDPNGISYNTSGTYPITMTVTDKGCSETITKNVTVLAEPVASLMPDTICDGPSVSFTHNSTNAISYHWDFGVTSSISDTSNQSSPTYIFPDTGNYDVTLIINPGYQCSDTTNAIYRVKRPIDLSFNTNAHQCITTHDFDFVMNGEYTSNAIFSWNFGVTSSTPTSNQENPQNITYPSEGYYPVTVSINDEGCTDDYISEVVVYPEVTIHFTGEEDGCLPVTVAYTDSSYSFDHLDYFWDFGDGNTSTEQNPTHIYDQAGIFDVSLNIIADTGCLANLTISKPDLITVFPIPNADFTINPSKVDVFEPEVSIFDASSEGVFSYYIVDQKDTLFNPNTSYIFNESGYRTVIQYMVNEYGCNDTAMRRVYVEPITTMYVPNAFTPDGDNINDVFKPIVFDVSNYELFILDRWGNLIFQTDQLDAGWDGVMRNGDCAPIDVYIWKINYKDANGINQKEIGHFSLLK